jgi:3-methyladenine DNA glycosylase Tag
MAAKDFYTQVIERVTKESALNNYDHPEYVKRQTNALELVMSDTAMVKSASKVEEIIKNAFTK